MEIGDYLRTQQGYIAKIIDIKYNETYNKGGLIILDSPTGYNQYMDNNNILKSSKSILDLIKEDDLVNGYPVVKIEENKIYLECFDGASITDLETECYQIIGYNLEADYILDTQIKTILTKERIEQYSYKVEV